MRADARAPCGWRWWLWLCAASTPRGAEAHGTPAPLPPSSSSERRLSGATFTSDIRLVGTRFSNEIGWELDCDDGVHHVGYTGSSPYGGIGANSGGKRGASLTTWDTGGFETWLANVVFQQNAICTLDLYDSYGDGWNGAQWTLPGLPAPRAFKMIDCWSTSNLAQNCPGNQQKGPTRFVFSVDSTTVTSAITVQDGADDSMVGWELSCTDGLHRLAFADHVPYLGF